MRLGLRARRTGVLPGHGQAPALLEAGAHVSGALGHDRIGTEHVLIALADDPGSRSGRALARLGLTSEVIRRDVERVVGPCIDPRRRPIDREALATLGIDLDEVVRRVEEAFGPGALARARRGAPGPSGDVPRRVAPRVAKALQAAAAEAGEGPLRGEHVLLALAAVEDCVAARVLRRHGVTAATLRDLLGDGAG